MGLNKYPFELPPLPYAYEALEPYIDRDTMYYHHDKHMKTYVDNLNKALENYPQYHDWTLEDLLCNLTQLPDGLREQVRNNAGGVYNHALYFDMMSPGGKHMPDKIYSTFGSAKDFKNAMKSKALAQFGSGFAWLVKDTSGDLKVIALPNQDNPITLGFTPVLPLDVWEHAYYLKYQNLRGDYIDAWFNIINWDGVEALL